MNKTIYPCSATLASLMLGVLAIIVLQEENFVLAAVLIFSGSILDTLDGSLAARLGAVSDIGKQLDSLADMVTFGVAPTILIYNLLLREGVNLPVAILISLVFVTAGAYRLARYNTLPSDRSAFFKGLPIPAASLTLIAGSFWQGWVVNLWWSLMVLLVSFLMVSTFPYSKIVHLKEVSPNFYMVLAGILAACWLLAGWQAVPYGLCLVYALSGPLRLNRLRAARETHPG